MIPSKNHPINCGLATTLNFSRVFTKKNIANQNFNINISLLPRVLSYNSSSLVTVYDKIVSRYVQSEYVNDYRINKNISTINFENKIIFSSSDSNILSIDNATNTAIYQNDGKCTIYATDYITGETDAIGIEVKKNTINSIDTFVEWANGSVSKNIADNIDNKLANKNSNVSKKIFSTQDHNNNTYVRNTDCWISTINSTCISPWNSNGISNKAGVLISPKHVLFAEHYKPTIGSTIRYVTMDNQVITKTITNMITDPAYSPYYPDISIGVLESDVPNTISFAKILPSDYINYFPSNLYSTKLPILVTDQEKNALVHDLNYISSTVNFIKPIVNNRINFYETVISGDSGSPVFLIINDELVLLCTLTYPDAGTFVTQRKGVINTIMSQLGGGYQLTEINLSSFLSY